MRVLILSFFVLLCLTAQSQTFSAMSWAVSNYQLESRVRKIGPDRYNEVRLKLDSLGKLCFAGKSDTLYIMESTSVESGEIIASIWNNTGRINYSYNQGSFRFDENISFSKYMIRLIEAWDVRAIGKEEREHSDMFDNSIIIATRIIKKMKGFKGLEGLDIESIKFLNFFKQERDGMD
ncbi:hypothetical protein [Pararcticibacter amylolyticus]|uniref:DUF4468 domain-containing protein n=1 Tax=Pararcticibacter amylolyticus TaxID=2173175 RepID=A0A2U2PAB6_9SPHI|nr:hypothetical protein [Pararcticibacter amylolyticus]PWG78244.1 hypothetical protein DDR33_23330 [Pararcticibacter amylolyticus]